MKKFGSFCFFEFQTSRLRINHLSQRFLALNYDKKMLTAYQPELDLFSYMVPNFFAENATFEFRQVKEEYKSTFGEDKTKNSISNSFIQLNIPIGTNEKLRNQFTRLETNYIRIGRLLEVLDGLVGLVAYRYCYSDFTNSNNRPLTIVTLSVNNFSLHTKEIDIFTDICLNSYVAYIGKSSLEIYSDLYQNEKIVASVQFLMVGRNAQDYTKSAQIPTLVIDNENEAIRDQCVLRFELGKQAQQTRIQESQNSLLKNAPNQQESELLHSLFFTKPDGVNIGSTCTQKNTLIQKQDRNIHGKTFGGFIMKEIIESGWLCGFKHQRGGHPHFLHIFDVLFLHPVPIGSYVNYTSRIVYVQGNIMIVQIQLHTHQFENKILIQQLTTEVFLALESDGEIQKVVPNTYEEGVAYLQGKRLFQKIN